MKIFCVSTGRCGTLFISEMFRTMTSMPSFHEPRPFCVGEIVEEVNNKEWMNFSDKTNEELYTKIDQVRRDSDSEGNYFESNQMFIKSYWLDMLKAFGQISAIYIERNPIEVLLSYHLKCPWQENTWFMESHWENVLMKTEYRQSFLENILWEWFEIKERWKMYKGLFDKTYDLDFYKINEVSEWKKLFAHFGIKHKVFDNIPELKKNAIKRDNEETLKDLISKWNIQGKRKDQLTNYEKKAQVIDVARKAISDNSRRLSKCMM